MCVVLFVVPNVRHMMSVRRYNLASHRINQKLWALEARRPETISPELWDASASWASISFCNICFSESHVPYEEMLRFERELDGKLAGSIDLDFFEWIWARLATVSPHGSRYVTRFKPNWDEQVQLDVERRQKATQQRQENHD